MCLRDGPTSSTPMKRDDYIHKMHKAYTKHYDVRHNNLQIPSYMGTYARRLILTILTHNGPYQLQQLRCSYSVGV